MRMAVPAVPVEALGSCPPRRRSSISVHIQHPARPELVLPVAVRVHSGAGGLRRSPVRSGHRSVAWRGAGGGCAHGAALLRRDPGARHLPPALRRPGPLTDPNIRPLTDPRHALRPVARPWCVSRDRQPPARAGAEAAGRWIGWARGPRAAGPGCEACAGDGPGWGRGGAAREGADVGKGGREQEA